jgi:hypothetical protein
MTWTRRGLVFWPDASRPWSRSHASLPVALPLGDGAARVYFASRDDRNRSHVGFAEVDLATLEVRRVSDGPVLEPGPLGHFDDHGVYPASFVEADGRVLLYYIGWSPGVEPPLFYSAIGLAVSDDGGETFERVSRVPVMARSEHDPCLVTSPFVLREGSRWRMWYVSGFLWERTPDGLVSFYDVKHAESDDGVDWRRDGTVCIALADGERNVSRPCVRADEGGYLMWFSANSGDGYRIQHADSADGLTWRRLGPVELAGERGEWETDAQCYPWVVGDTMLYNGNGFGRSGFGAAVR